MNADGSDQTQLTHGPTYDPAWSPDGKKLAYSSIGFEPTHELGTVKTADLHVMNADGSSDTTLMISNGLSDYQSPAWSPDGTKIAFQKTEETGGEGIYVISTSGKEDDANEPRPLTAGWNLSPRAWSPDGTEIAFVGYDANGTPDPAAAYVIGSRWSTAYN